MIAEAERHVATLAGQVAEQRTELARTKKESSVAVAALEATKAEHAQIKKQFAALAK